MERFDTKLMHPRDQISMVITRIYKAGLTTTSGGNISVIEENGDIWVTPSAVDKGSLTPKDIILVKKDGEVVGDHKPSSEFPFHKSILEKRKDLKAVIHAHSPALVAFSIVRQFPNTNLIPQAKDICGEIGYATYELPGSQELGDSIAKEFDKGVNAVILENHGVVVGGTDLKDAYERFETLEFCARTIIKAKSIGEPTILSNAAIEKFKSKFNQIPLELDKVEHPADEREIRTEICRMIKRACDQELMIGTYGTMSARWRGNDFLITPRNVTRWNIRPKDVVQMKDSKREPGKLPSRSVTLHQEIYKRNPEINAIISTQSTNIMAFSVTGQHFDDRTIPESWILLQDVPSVPFEEHFKQGEKLADHISPTSPVMIVQNDAIMVTGKNILHAFDRLEVAEFSARSILLSLRLGTMVPISDNQIEDLRKAFSKVI
jgi:L-fuculose-phosphate aldolase